MQPNLLNFSYTRRRLRGRQPLCGTGVVSLIEVTTKPALIKARTAASRPAPGPFSSTSTSFIPIDVAFLAASAAASVAAKAEDFLEPEKFTLPPEAHERTLPAGSVMTIIVLLNVALTCAIPDGTLCATFFFVLTGFLELAGCLLKVKNSSTYSYFFLLATVLRLPFLVLELVLVRCPRTGKPRR